MIINIVIMGIWYAVIKALQKEPVNFDFRLKWFLYNLTSHYTFYILHIK
jgi:hypothetical protein